MTRNVFVIGVNDLNRRLLGTIRNGEGYAFHDVLRPQEVEDPTEYRAEDLLDQARAELRRFPGSIDAIVGYIDIPVTLMVPILCREFGVPSPSLESVLKCQHKYWSRLQQREVIPEHIPRFCRLDPFDEASIQGVDLGYPFWLKPVKSAGSFLGYRIANGRQLREKTAIIREHIARVAQPFDYLLGFADIPPEVADVDGRFCIAEGLISGRQCTLEGYVYQGDVRVYGVVDSIRYPNRSSFFRYQYPSQLPRRVVERMSGVVARVLRHVGLDSSAFNAELFWDERRDRIWLLEINTRISQSHSPLFELVDGASNHQVMVECGLGQRPASPHREGRFACAAKFFYRRFRDARIDRVPSEDEVRAIERRFPGTSIKVNVSAGIDLSELIEQDSYSYDLAWIFTGARNRRELLQRYRACVDALGLRFTEIDRSARPRRVAGG